MYIKYKIIKLTRPHWGLKKHERKHSYNKTETRDISIKHLITTTGSA
mgnify:FL=1